MKLLILGTRGIPAAYGGFETFAEQLALYLVARGHEVIVYCQQPEHVAPFTDFWKGVQRIHIPAPVNAAGTIIFDWESVKQASRTDGIVLTLGYNTAILSLLYRLRGVRHIMNMDGLEWRRAKWSKPQRIWLWFNELAGSLLANHLVADHPDIKAHLRRHTRDSKISVIPYGASVVEPSEIPDEIPFGLKGRSYFLVIARPEPENSILEIVKAFSMKRRNSLLVVLGKYEPEHFPYQKAVMDAASDEVLFPGALYDRAKVAVLRYHARAYVHGHTVGGTNPSLVESLAAGNPIIAHDNIFTRWVAGEAARYFKTPEDLSETFERLELESGELRAMQQGSLKRHGVDFTQDKVLGAYERLLLQWSKAPARASVPVSSASNS